MASFARSARSLALLQLAALLLAYAVITSTAGDFSFFFVLAEFASMHLIVQYPDFVFIFAEMLVDPSDPFQPNDPGSGWLDRVPRAAAGVDRVPRAAAAGVDRVPRAAAATVDRVPRAAAGVDRVPRAAAGTDRVPRAAGDHE